MVTIISNLRAREISGEWHEGGHSALYQFTSSGVFVLENARKYLFEVQICIESEFWTYPRTLSQKDQKQLRSLKNWFTYKCKENGLAVTWAKHPDYGYLVPFLEGENVDKVASLYLPI